MEPFVVVERFCVGSDDQLKWNVREPSPNLWLLLFRERRLSALAEVSEMMTLEERFEAAEVRIPLVNRSRGSLALSSGRRRWILAGVANVDVHCEGYCYAGIETTVEEFHGGMSCEDRGVVWIEGFALGSYACLAVFAVFKVRTDLLTNDKLHKTPKLIIWATLLGLLHRIFAFTAEFLAKKNIYSSSSKTDDGQALYFVLLSVARFMFLALDCVLAITLLLMAKGLDVVRRKIPTFRERCGVAVHATTLACAAVIYWASFFYDRLLPGYVCARSFVALVVYLSSRKTLATTRSLASPWAKKTSVFYERFQTTVCLPWILSLPLGLLAAALVPDFDRRRAMKIAEFITIFPAHFNLLRLISPSSKHFPFTATTTAPSLLLRHTAPGNRLSGVLARFASVTGGRARDVNADGKYVVKDGFEALAIVRLRRAQKALEARLDRLQRTATDLQDGFSQKVVIT